MSVIKVTVASGCSVRAPSGGRVPDRFSVEENDPYWSVKLRRGEIVRVAVQAEAKTATIPAPVATPVASPEPAKAKS